MEITDTKEVWIAWTNADLTEGRGYQYPLAVCEKLATARRLGHKKSVQGSDCDITKGIAIEVNGTWLAPTRIHSSSREDDAEQSRIDKKNEVIMRARKAGLTDDDLKILLQRNNP